MFCSNCGKEITGEDSFCRHCGAKQTPIERSEPSSPPKETEVEKDNAGSCFLKILLALFLLFFGPLIVFSSIDPSITKSCAGSTASQTFSRDANNGDVELDFDESLTSLCIIIRPYKDIENLKITIEFSNSKGDILTSEVKTIGNVKEGQEYKTYISIFDLPVTVSQYRAKVSGGTVSYLQ